MDQQSLFHEDIYDALRDCVKALGGAKKVGANLWPDKPLNSAHRHLLDCLNPDLVAKLDLFQIVKILRDAGEAGCHIGMEFLATECGYEQPKWKSPKQVKNERIEAATDALKQSTETCKRLERLLLAETNRTAA